MPSILIPARAALPDTIERVKPSVVVVGTFSKLRSPAFVMRGTGFAVADGHVVATNAHVIPETVDGEANETLIVLIPGGGEPQQRGAKLLAMDKSHDLALLRIDGAPLRAVNVHGADGIREGQAIAFTGFPIGGALGFSPVTHRGVISAITPIVLPGARAQQVNQQMIRQLRAGAFMIYQLDATAYPGNSGSPMYDADSGDVLGIINMVFVKATKEAALSDPSGISFAVPAQFLIDLLEGRKSAP